MYKTEQQQKLYITLFFRVCSPSLWCNWMLLFCGNIWPGWWCPILFWEINKAGHLDCFCLWKYEWSLYIKYILGYVNVNLLNLSWLLYSISIRFHFYNIKRKKGSSVSHLIKNVGYWKLGASTDFINKVKTKLLYFYFIAVLGRSLWLFWCVSW